jgi:cytochrome c oxidase assembly protein subunit 15
MVGAHAPGARARARRSAILSAVTRRLRISPARYHQVAIAALALLTLIVFSGAAVRLTGSGLGCEGWPACEEGKVVAPLETHAVIEFTNRIFSGIVALGAIAAGLLAFVRDPRRRDLCVLGVMLPLGVVAQAVLGGLSVVYELRPGFVMGHYALSLVILIPAWALVWRSRPGFEDGFAPGAPDRLTMWAVRAIAPLGAFMVFVGTAATAAGPHAGGRGTGDLVDRLYVKGPDTLDWAVDQHTRVGAVLGLVALVALGIAWYRGGSRRLVAALGSVVVLLGIQGVVGAVQYQAQLPAELVWVHVSLAAVLWVAILWAWSEAGTPVGHRAADRTADQLAASA